jgi:hypothetical protein
MFNALVPLKRGDLQSTYRLIRKFLSHRLNQHLDQRFDGKFNVDTIGFVHKTEVTIHSDNAPFGANYAPTPVRLFRRMMLVLPRELSDFTFIDFGSGKGRTLLLASNYNFKKVIGVEYAEELHAAALKNIAVYQNKSEKRLYIESVLADAVTFPIPNEKCVFFFYNPFKEYVMSRVLINIENSYLANPRKMYFIYYNPVFSTLFDNLSFIHRIGNEGVSLRLMNPDTKPRFIVYETAA